MPGCLPVCRCLGDLRGQAQVLRGAQQGPCFRQIRRQHRRSCRRDWAAGFRLPGARHWRGRRDLRSRYPAAARGCRPRRACRSRGGTRHWSRPGGRRRPPRRRLAAMTTRTPWVSAPGRSGSRRLIAGERCVTPYAQSPPGAYAPTRITRTSLPTGRKGERCRGGGTASPADSGGISSWRVPRRSQARRLPSGAGPRRHGQGLVSPLPGASPPAAGASLA